MRFSLFDALLPQEQILGFSLDGSLMHFAQVSVSGKKIKIIKLYTETVKPLDSALPNTTTLISCLPSRKTLARPLEIALTKPKDVDAAYAFEAEAHLPYPIESSVLAKVTLSTSKTSTQLELFSTLKSDLQDHLNKIIELHLDPEVICPKPLALCHFVSQFYAKSGLQIAIDIDHEETSCVLIKDGLPVLARAHPIGLEKLQCVTCCDEAGNVSINEDHLPFLHEYLREISRILLSFQTAQDSQEIPLLFTGPVVDHPILTELFSAFLHKELAACPEGFVQKEFSWLQLCAFACPLGATLSRHFETKGQSVNFRKGEFAFSGKWRRMKRELAIYVCLMIALSSAFYVWGQAKLSNQERRLVEKYTSLLVALEKPQEQEVIALSADEVDDKLYELEKELTQTTDEMALHPDVPRVSDLLAWLATHPKVVDQENLDKSLTLESLAYTMVKRPEKGKTKEHYQVRVDLEFSSPSATMAREFHDALLAPNPFVDPKNELKWSVHRGRYRASFFLKDRTKYPQQTLEVLS